MGHGSARKVAMPVPAMAQPQGPKPRRSRGADAANPSLVSALLDFSNFTFTVPSPADMVGALKTVLASRRPCKTTVPVLPDVVMGARLAFGLLLGLLFAAAGLKGVFLVGLALYFGAATAGMSHYLTNVLHADVDSYGSGVVSQAGLMPGFAVFLLTWTVLA